MTLDEELKLLGFTVKPFCPASTVYHKILDKNNEVVFEGKILEIWDWVKSQKKL